MTDLSTPDIQAPRTIRSHTLVYLRWVAVIGQSVALGVAWWMGLEISYWILGGIISLAVWVNVFQLLLLPKHYRCTERQAFFWILFDATQIAGLLYFAGGLNNTFAVLLIGPVTVAAAVLHRNYATYMTIYVAAAILLLGFFHTPLVSKQFAVLELPPLLRLGLAAGLVVASVFIAVYVSRLAGEATRQTEALSAVQLALAREQRLAALGGLAASAAHELGTPLATIALTAKELQHELQSSPEQLEDVRLIRSEIRRCRDILANLRERGGEMHHDRLPITALIEEAAAPYSDAPGKEIIIRISGMLADLAPAASIPLLEPKPEIIHGLRNLIQNAIDFARNTVLISVTRTDTALRLTITDDGPGFSPDIIEQLGEPFISSRNKWRRASGLARGHYEGMGLGVFIAKSLLELTGARVHFSNASEPSEGIDRAEGAEITIIWPPESIPGSITETPKKH